MGFKISDHDTAMYYRVGEYKGKERMDLVLLYVDDYYSAHLNDEQADGFYDEIRKHGLELTVDPDAGAYLGFEIEKEDTPDGEALILHANSFEQEFVKQYDPDGNIKPRTTPGDPNLTFAAVQEDCELNGSNDKDSVKKAKGIVGSALYAAGRAAPSTASAVVLLASTANKPGPLWWKAARHLIGHFKLRAAQKVGLRYTPRKRGEPLIPKIEILSDSSFATTKTYRSLGGYLIAVGGEVIDWRSSLTRIVTLSTLESECCHYSDAVRAGLYFQQLLAQLGICIKTIDTATDNQALYKVINGGSLSRSKHISYRFVHARDMLKDGYLSVSHLGTHYMLADIMSKPMRNQRMFHFLRDQFMHVQNPIELGTG